MLREEQKRNPTGTVGREEVDLLFEKARLSPVDALRTSCIRSPSSHLSLSGVSVPIHGKRGIQFSHFLLP